MEDARKPDTVITTEVIHGLMKRIEVDYYVADDARNRRFIVKTGFYFLAAYLDSLRGEEVPRTVSYHMYELDEESFTVSPPHYILPLYGCFKNEQGVPHCFTLRISMVTKTGLNMKKWVERILEGEQSSNTMYVYANYSGVKERGSLYEPYFFAKLKATHSEERAGFELEDTLSMDK